MEDLGPTARWPPHSRAMAQAALQLAKSEGWSLRPSNGHAFGLLRCRRQDHVCKVAVFSTSGPKDGSTTANVIHAAIMKCQRLRGDKQSEETTARSCREIKSDVAKLTRLVDALERLDDREKYEQEFEDALEAGELEAAVTHEDASQVATNEAMGLAAAGGFQTDPWPPEDGKSAVLGPAESLHRRCTDEAIESCPALSAELTNLGLRLIRHREQS